MTSRNVKTAVTSVMVPYCDVCDEAIGAMETRRFAVSLAAVVVPFTVGLTLPNWFPLALGLGYGASVVFSALLPVLILWAVRRRPASPRSSEGHAVWWGSSGRLVCTRFAWAEELANKNGAVAHRSQTREPIVDVRCFIGALAALLLSPVAYTLLYPITMVLNLGGQPVQLQLDGRSLFVVEPTSLESSDSGTALRASSGEHVVRVLDDTDTVLKEYSIRVRPGRQHLLAPMSGGYCFWLEYTSYGRSGTAPEPRPLPTAREFWILPDRVDTWFEPNPSETPDQRSSGGRLVALRHAPCGSELP